MNDELTKKEMSKERLEELSDDLPYTIRHSGELEPLKQFAREQAERVHELENEYQVRQIEYLEEHIDRLEKENKRYQEVINNINEKASLFGVFVKLKLDDIRKLTDNAKKYSKKYSSERIVQVELDRVMAEIDLTRKALEGDLDE